MTPRRTLTPADARRATRAVIAGGAMGLVVAVAVRLVAVPALAEAIRDGRMEWLVSLWRRSPAWVMILALAVTAIVSLPVLFVARWAAQPRPGDERSLLE